jgi:site-specific recombinase XerD
LEHAPRVRFVKKGVQDFDFPDFAEYRRLIATALRSMRHLRVEFVFSHDDGVPWTRDWADAALRRQCRRAGLREISWHVLRHTFCSHLAMQGAPAKAIQELARHTSLGVTQRYMHLCSDHRRDAIDLLDARPDGHQLGTGDQAKMQTADKKRR